MAHDQVLHSSVTANGSSTEFTISETGTYELSYDIYFAAPLLVNFNITQNGDTIPETAVTITSPVSHFEKTATVDLDAGDVLSLQLRGLLGVAVLSSDNPTTLTFTRIN